MLFPSRATTHLASASSARMHSLSASRLLLISAPSSRVCLSFSYVSAQVDEAGADCIGGVHRVVLAGKVPSAGSLAVLQVPARNCCLPAPRSLPARSMKDSFPTVFGGSLLVRSAKHRIECDLQGDPWPACRVVSCLSHEG